MIVPAADARGALTELPQSRQSSRRHPASALHHWVGFLWGWLASSPGVSVLRDLVNGRLPLTHDALDALPQRAAIIHLHQLLVACGALPQRDPNLARLERAVEKLAGSLDEPEDRKLIREFARWRILRRARRRAERDELGVTAATNARTVVVEAVRFLEWLRDRGLSLRQCRQADVDLWLTTGVAARRRIGEFLRWAQERKAVGQIEAPDSRAKSGAPRPIDAEGRWAIARRLIRDDTLDPADRFVGTLVVLYGQPGHSHRQAPVGPTLSSSTTRRHSVGVAKELMPIAEPLGSVVDRHRSPTTTEGSCGRRWHLPRDATRQHPECVVGASPTGTSPCRCPPFVVDGPRARARGWEALADT